MAGNGPHGELDEDGADCMHTAAQDAKEERERGKAGVATVEGKKRFPKTRRTASPIPRRSSAHGVHLCPVPRSRRAS